MNDYIKSYIARCVICQSVDVEQQKETWHPHEIPEGPSGKVGTHLFTYDNKDDLIRVDYYSNFWEMDY